MNKNKYEWQRLSRENRQKKADAILLFLFALSLALVFSSAELLTNYIL